MMDLDWDMFSADGDSKETEETSTGTPGLGERLAECLRAAFNGTAPDMLDPDTKRDVLKTVADILGMDDKEDDSGHCSEAGGNLLYLIGEAVRRRDIQALRDLFGSPSHEEIPPLRDALRSFITEGGCPPEGFWFLVTSVLEANPQVFRKPISEAAGSLGDASRYRTSDNVLLRVSELLLENRDKIHQTLKFFLAFKSMLPQAVRTDLRDSADLLNDAESMSLLFRICDADTTGMLYMLCGNDSPECIYMGYGILRAYRDAHGLEALRRLPFLREYLNCMDGSTAKELIGRLILKDVLEEADTMPDEQARRLSESFASFSAELSRISGKEARKALSKALPGMMGRSVEFCPNHIGEWHAHGSLRGGGCGAILPKSFAKKPSARLSDRSWEEASVVLVHRNPNVLVLAQRKVSRKEAEAVTLVCPGDIVEVRFSLQDKKLIPRVLGCGPVRASIRRVPPRFDYKVKHKARVTSVQDFCTCEIEIID